MLVGFGWNFRRENSETTWQELTYYFTEILTASILLAFQIHHWKNIKFPKQLLCLCGLWSVSSSLPTAIAQRVLLEHLTSNVDATAWLPSQWPSGQTSATLQSVVLWADWYHRCVCDTPTTLVHSRARETGFRSGLFGSHNCVQCLLRQQSNCFLCAVCARGSTACWSVKYPLEIMLSYYNLLNIALKIYISTKYYCCWSKFDKVVAKTSRGQFILGLQSGDPGRFSNPEIPCFALTAYSLHTSRRKIRKYESSLNKSWKKVSFSIHVDIYHDVFTCKYHHNITIYIVDMSLIFLCKQ